MNNTGVYPCFFRCQIRDFKSANVFMAEGGIVKVGDFGVSKVLADTLALAKTAIGTPYYLCPEICMSRPYNAKVRAPDHECGIHPACALSKLHGPASACSASGIPQGLRCIQSDVECLPM